jgi:hypothetical protein
MSKLRNGLLVLLLLAPFAAVAYLALLSGAEAGKGMPEYSVYSNEHDGMATAAGVLRKLNFRPIAVTRPIQHTHYRGLLLLAEPVQMDAFGTVSPGLSERDAKALLEWVGKGNTLVLLGKNTTRLHEMLGATVVKDQKGDSAVYLAEAVEVGGYTEPGAAADTIQVQNVGVETRDAVSARGAVPLWMAGGGPGAAVVPHGEGRVLVVADPSVWTHRGLLRGDNVLLLYNVAALDSDQRQVYFDEYHHGLRSGGGYWDYLRYHDQHWNLLQLAALAAVAVWASAVRLGPAVPTPRPSRADAVDYASAAARIYERAGVTHLMAQNLVRDFLGALTRHLRLKRNAVPAAVLAAWKAKHGKESAERLSGLLRGAMELRRAAAKKEEDVPQRELLSWAQEFDGFLKDHQLSREGGQLARKKR